MSYRRRRFSRFSPSGQNVFSSSNSYSQSEPYALCFYLYVGFENVDNKFVLDEASDALKLFLRCAKKLQKLERLKAIIENEIAELIEQKQLTKIEKSDSSIAYEEDKEFSIRFSMNGDAITELVVNLCRVFYASQKPIFSAIINSVIFKNSRDNKISYTLSLTKKMRKNIFDISATQFLVDQVKLSENEARYILLQSRFSSNQFLNDAFCSLADLNDERQNNVSAMIGVSQNELRAMLRSDQKIRTFGFLDEDKEFDSTLNDCIEAQTIEPFFSDLLKPLDCSDAYSLDSFSVKPESLEVCLDLLNGKNPVSILFYGKPGSGKTELAKTLGKISGKHVYVFKNETENDRCILNRLMCLLSMDRDDALFIVDEADSILQTIKFTFFSMTPTLDKGTINSMLEHSKNKAIFIINHVGQIDMSTRRRFTFSIQFEAMPESMLRAIAKSKLAPLAISNNAKENLISLFNQYHLTGASVDNIVKVIDGMQSADEDLLLRKAQTVMKENATLLEGKTKMRETVKSEYDTSVLNINVDVQKIIEMVQNATKFAEKNKTSESGIRMLFYGLSETGKTELARYIAGQLGKHIVLKRASDILGKYVGENEANIRSAFTEAENSNAILLFDEADSFFSDRNNAEYTWERTLVNEFLTQMEEFSGILICTTNLRNIMDPAMQRRFHLLVEFKPMKRDGIQKMMSRYFSSLAFSEKQIADLEDMKTVTPGDFGVLADRMRFMNDDDVNAPYVFDELKNMQAEKKKRERGDFDTDHRIGFVGE